MGEKRILAIDDDLSSLNMIRAILSKAGYEVLTASSGIEGIGVAAGKHPQLIILDIMMPGMDGSETAEQLKANQRTKDIPIIFLSALIREEEERMSKKEDTPSLIAKPIEREKLLNEVRRYFNSGEDL